MESVESGEVLSFDEGEVGDMIEEETYEVKEDKKDDDEITNQTVDDDKKNHKNMQCNLEDVDEIDSRLQKIAHYVKKLRDLRSRLDDKKLRRERKRVRLELMTESASDEVNQESSRTSSDSSCSDTSGSDEETQRLLNVPIKNFKSLRNVPQLSLVKGVVEFDKSNVAFKDLSSLYKVSINTFFPRIILFQHNIVTNQTLMAIAEAS